MTFLESELPGFTFFRLNAFYSGSREGKEARDRAYLSQAEKEIAMSREGKFVVEAQPQKSKSGPDKKKGIFSFK